MVRKMKVACDFCEKVKYADSESVKRNWKRMKFSTLEYLLCEKCSDELFHYIDKAKGLEKNENNNRQRLDENV